MTIYEFILPMDHINASNIYCERGGTVEAETPAEYTTTRSDGRKYAQGKNWHFKKNELGITKEKSIHSGRTPAWSYTNTGTKDQVKEEAVEAFRTYLLSLAEKFKGE